MRDKLDNKCYQVVEAAAAAVTLGVKISSLFNDPRHKLTSSDISNIVPFSGSVYNSMKNYIATHVTYVEDLTVNYNGQTFSKLPIFLTCVISGNNAAGLKGKSFAAIEEEMKLERNGKYLDYTNLKKYCMPGTNPNFNICGATLSDTQEMQNGNNPSAMKDVFNNFPALFYGSPDDVQTTQTSTLNNSIASAQTGNITQSALATKNNSKVYIYILIGIFLIILLAYLLKGKNL